MVDESCAFVTSANFTEAAQERNIEAGVCIEGPTFARTLATQLRRLIAGTVVRRLPGT